MNNLRFGLISLLLMSSFFSAQGLANTYSQPETSNALIGQVQYGNTVFNENVVEIAKRYNLGVNQVANANPHIDSARGFQAGLVMKIPSSHILPPLPREGIVINLSEMRLYYYPPGGGIVKTYPVGIGKVGKVIPLTKTYVAQKLVNPVWTPTKSIRDFNREHGIILPASIPPGPDNPLGPYAIYLGIPEFRIHSTIYPESIGKRASFGCIRMNEEDIKDFFPLLTTKTPVNIVDLPTKVGWVGNKLYLEAHPPLEESPSPLASYPGMVQMLAQSTQDQPVLIDWQLVNYLANEHDGTPHEVGTRLTHNNPEPPHTLPIK